MTSTNHTLTQAWPACAVGAWAAAWIAGRCSPDDVGDTLNALADTHVIDDHTGCDTPDGTLGVLAMLRDARRLSVRLPDAGAVQGLPPDPATTAAFTAGEVLLVDDGRPTPLALVPADHDGLCRWSVYRYTVPVPTGALPHAGDIEYELRQAVTEATALIGRLGGRTASGPADLRGTLRMLTHRNLVELPPHDDARATRMIATAAQVEAIVGLATDGGVTVGASAGHAADGDAGLRRLVVLAHAARAAAVDRVITEFLPTGW
ncbi:MAG: hypothetical protein QM662_19415 [Gordonia sp. (in: high G+C Gram-positive bacteria)]